MNGHHKENQHDDSSMPRDSSFSAKSPPICRLHLDVSAAKQYEMRFQRDLMAKMCQNKIQRPGWHNQEPSPSETVGLEDPRYSKRLVINLIVKDWHRTECTE